MNITNKKLGLGVVALAVALAGSAAIADGKGKPGGPMGMMHPAFDFAAADTNKDGKVSVEEFAAYRAATAVAMDSDKDGKLSIAELAVCFLDAHPPGRNAHRPTPSAASQPSAPLRPAGVVYA